MDKTVQYLVYDSDMATIYSVFGMIWNERKREENTLNLSESAIKVLEKRYLEKDKDGNCIETPEGMFRRVADAIAAADLLYDKKADVDAVSEEFFELMTSTAFLPNSPTLMNAGRPLGQLSACFVLPVEDSMEAIFETIKQAAIIHKSGGGTGFSFARIRPQGSTVGSTGGVASGPISFMKVFNAATEAVKQGGTRRGANMGILRVDHPDILDFITCKQDNSEITNFNISVGITEAFMQAVERGSDYDLIDPSTKKKVASLSAREVFEKLVVAAWSNGEPGIIFLDRINAKNIVPDVAEIESTNPCGEQPLLPYESCNLGSINLSIMVKSAGGKLVVDYDRLRTTVETAVHFLDNVIDVNKYPLEQIDFTTKQTRKIGLGVMGFADMLYKLGVRYDSEESVQLAEEIMQFVDGTAKQASMELAKTRGVFPLFDRSIYAGTDMRLRNATVTTIAPTGTISMIAGTSSGVEPVFAISFIRNVMDNTELVETNPVFRDCAIKGGFYSESLMKKIAQQGSLHGIAEVPREVRNVFVTAHDVSPIWHIKIQAAFQKYTDNAVSKTVNFPHDATVDDVREVFELAYEMDCKGVTIYRDGSRDLQVLNIGKVNGKEEAPAQTPGKVIPRQRPEVTTGFTEKIQIGCGNLYVTVNYDEHDICEVFTNTGRGGGCPSQSEATARLVSIALRSGLDTGAIIEQLRGIRCPSTIKRGNLKVTSCPDAIAKVIQKVYSFQQNGKKPPTAAEVESIQIEDLPDCDGGCADCSMKFSCNNPKKASGKLCPECGAELEHEGGCVTCRSCGYSKCG